MTAELRRKYEPLLKEYGVEIEYMEDLGSIKKIHSSHGILALKKTKLPYSQLAQYDNKIRFLQYKCYGFSAPIYRTSAGSAFVFDEEQAAYYLMPWLEIRDDLNRSDNGIQLFKTLGEFHSKTVTEEKITSEQSKSYVKAEKERWNRQKEEAELFVDKCEEQQYMSPFELYFCTFYQEVMKATDFAMRKLDEWQEFINDKETFRNVFTHGKPTFQHFLYNEDGKGVFINFEQANHYPPMYDLLYFFSRSCKTYPSITDDRFQWFQTYRKNFPLTTHEISFFMAQLAYPKSMYKAMETYKHQKLKKSEIKHIQSLQRAYWQMKNIESFLTHIVIYEDKIKEQESQMEAP